MGLKKWRGLTGYTFDKDIKQLFFISNVKSDDLLLHSHNHIKVIINFDMLNLFMEGWIASNIYICWIMTI